MKKINTEQMDASQVFCPNLDCLARGQVGQGNIVIHSRTPGRYRCKTCKKTFSARRGTLFEGLRKPVELIVIVVTLLSYGCPRQAIVHAFGLDERTVGEWQERAGQHCRQVHQAIVLQGQLDLVHEQADVVALGVHGGDHFIYPDCRPGFIKSFEAMQREAVEGFGNPSLRLEAPFLYMSKQQVVQLGSALHVPYAETWSCYKGGEYHCGTCGTCFERKEAFELAGVPDPTIYERVEDATSLPH